MRAMVVMLYIFAALEFIGGRGVLVGSKDTIREVVGTLLVGFSIITAGLAGTLAEVAMRRPHQERGPRLGRSGLLSRNPPSPVAEDDDVVFFAMLALSAIRLVASYPIVRASGLE
jgi:hypothetical protein